MTSVVVIVPWEQFFAAEQDRLKRFYLIELNEEDFSEIERWLKDRLEVNSGSLIVEKLRNMPELEIRQVRYDFIQFVKRNRRIKNSQAHGKLPTIGAAKPLGESEERDRRIE